MNFWWRRDQIIDCEIQDYLDRETQANVESGMPPEQALAAARRKLGSVVRVKEDTRAAWGWIWFERLWQDVRYGLRNFAKNPGFTAVVVVSLAIGIGANCAMFTLADGLLLRPLPVPRPAEVLSVGSIRSLAAFNQLNSSWPDYVDLRERTQSFSGLTAFAFRSFGFAVDDALPKLTVGMAVSANLFSAMEVTPELGRGFLPEENEVQGRDAVVVLDHGFWETQFGSDPTVLGRRIRLNKVDFRVIGVAPPEFAGIGQYMRPAFYLPIMMLPRLTSDPELLTSRDHREFQVRGRLKPGATVQQARAEVGVLGQNLERAHPATNRNQVMTARTQLEARIQQSPPDAMLVGMLMTLAFAVLVVACANVAGLFTSRAPVRAREISLRLAIGAGRPRLIRQLLTECMLLALGGGALGIGVGYAGIRMFRRIEIPTDLPFTLSFRLDGRALLVCLLTAVASILLFGLVPTLRATREDVANSLKSAEPGVSGKRRYWGRSALVMGQVAVALGLLAVTMFIYREFSRTLGAGPGFRTDHLMMMSFDPGLVRYTEGQSQQFYRSLVERAREVSGVQAVSLISAVPMDSDGLGDAAIVPEGYVLPAGQETVNVFSATVDDRYFDVMNIPITRGRGFHETDTAGRPLVAIANEVLAAHYWPGKDPIGQRFRLNSSQGPWVEIVGIAKLSKYAWVGEAPLDFLYLPLRQKPTQLMTLLAQSKGDAVALTGPLREMVRGLDRDLPVFNVRTMQQLYEMRAVRISNVLITVVGALGTMGLALALVGLYGLVSFASIRRTREIGIRMAIGASRADILRMLLGSGAALCLIGIVAGTALSLGGSRMLQAVFPASQLGLDIGAFVAVVFAVLAIVLTAALIPALRASRVNPTQALRYE